MAIFKYANGVKTEMTKREIKAGTMKLKGWTAEEYRKQYDLLKNKTRAYEAFMEAKGENETKQSISEMLYRQAKAEHRYGSAYKPSAKIKLITSFPAVSISRGKKLAKEVGSIYEERRLDAISIQTQMAFANFIAQVKKAQEINENIKDPIKKEKALAALADYIHKKQKTMKSATSDGMPFAGETFGSDPLGEDFNYDQWL